MSDRLAVNVRWNVRRAGHWKYQTNIKGVDRTLIWHGYAHKNGKMVGITRMNVPEKTPKQLLLTNIHSLILIPNTDSYIFYLLIPIPTLLFLCRLPLQFIQNGRRPVSTTFSYRFVSLFYSFYSEPSPIITRPTTHTKKRALCFCNLPAHLNPAQPIMTA